MGIHGHSYGGTMVLHALLRAPDRFHVGVAGSPGSDFRLYDTGYTERYMGLLDGAAGLLERGGEAATVVEAEVTFEVALLLEGDPLLLQDTREHRLVDGLVVDQDTVEIEEDRPQHLPRIITPPVCYLE